MGPFRCLLPVLILCAISVATNAVTNTETWSTNDVGKWVKGLGSPLAKYSDVFMEQEITGKELILLDNDWLRELGITTIGHRLKFKSALEALAPTKFQPKDAKPTGTTDSKPAKALSQRTAKRWNTLAEMEPALASLRMGPTAALYDMLKLQLAMRGTKSRIVDKFGRSMAISSASHLELAAALRVRLTDAVRAPKAPVPAAPQAQPAAPPVPVTYSIKQLSPQPGEEWFGLAITLGNSSTDLILWEGDNSTEAAVNFLHAHSAMSPEAILHLANTLESVGGGACDACNTFVEEVTQSFVSMATSAEGQKKQKAHKVNMGQTVGWSVGFEPETITTLKAICDSEQMQTYAPHVIQGCRWYVANNVTETIFAKDGEANGEKEIVDRKQRICVDLVKHCAPRAPVPAHLISRCRSCSEAMADLGYDLRRTARDIKFSTTKEHYASPLQREVLSRRARVDRYAGYRSRVHVHSRLVTLCDTAKLRHPQGVAEEIGDVCEDLSSEFEASIVDAFADPDGTDGDAIKEVCVAVTESCTHNEFQSIRKQLRSYVLDQPGGIQARQEAGSPTANVKGEPPKM